MPHSVSVMVDQRISEKTLGTEHNGRAKAEAVHVIQHGIKVAGVPEASSASAHPD